MPIKGRNCLSRPASTKSASYAITPAMKLASPTPAQQNLIQYKAWVIIEAYLFKG